MAETPAQKAKRLGVPVIGSRIAPKPPADPDPPIGVCGRCGVTLKRRMNYACDDEQWCPVGLGPRGA